MIMKKHTEAVALAAILLLALGLRAWGIGWGMPYAFHPDEDNYLPGAMGMLLKGDLNPHYFANPPLLTYAVLAELFAYLKVGQLLGLLQTPMDVGLQLLVAPTPLYAMARMTSALAGTATVLVTYWIARRLFGGRVGLLSALLLAVAFLPVRDSHYAVNDVPATFLLMASFALAVSVYRLGDVGKGLVPFRTVAPDRPAAGDEPLPYVTGRPWVPYLLSGLLLGLATATKYNVGLGAAAIAAAHLLRYRSWAGLLDARSHLPLLAAAGAALGGFLLGNPYALLDYPAFIKGFTGQYGWAGDPYSTTDLSMALVIGRALWVGAGPVVLVAAVLGLAVALARISRPALLLAAFPAAYLAFFLLKSELFYARFALPLIPFVAILAAYGAVALARRLPSGAIWRMGAAVAVAALLVPSLVLSVKHDSLLGIEDTRLQLGRWIEENVPPGSRIAAEGYSYLDSRGHKTGPKKLDYALSMPSSLKGGTLNSYRQEGYDYLVASSFVYGRYQADPAVHDASIEFYRQLDRELPLAASFHPTHDGSELPFLMDDEITPIWTVLDRSRPGPSLKVYRLGAPPEYAVAWSVPSPPSTVGPGEGFSLPISLANQGNMAWPAEGYTPVRIGYRWLDGSGGTVPAPEIHSPLPRSLAPGQEARAAGPHHRPLRTGGLHPPDRPGVGELLLAIG